jgi:TPR repeat protein
MRAGRLISAMLLLALAIPRAAFADIPAPQPVTPEFLEKLLGGAQVDGFTPVLAPTPAPTADTSTDFQANMAKASAGDLTAYLRVGDACRLGNGVTQDVHAAMRWYTAAAARDCVPAMARVGYMYAHGLGATQDLGRAVAWYQKGADRNDPLAMNNLGYCYQNGLGVGLDYNAALNWYQSAAANGDPHAQNNIAYLYSHHLVALPAEHDGDLIEQTYRTAADRGLAIARYNQARSLEQDATEQFQWDHIIALYHQAPDAGDVEAMAQLESHYRLGLGVPADSKEGFKWGMTAAVNGSPAAQFDIAGMYETGTGVEKNAAQAAKWYQRAADAGDDRAKKWLAEHPN